jgi:alpha-beta hydrolase superfamily lysophospholipase
MTTEEVSFPSSDGSVTLFGNLTLPNNSTGEATPAILIINGSGPIDRNGNVPSLKMTLNTSNQFAHHMSNRPSDKPIAVFCYDKRGVGKSTTKDKNLFYRTGLDDLVSDAVEAVRYLINHPKIDAKRIVIVGHSEGAIIMPLICKQIKEAGLEPPAGCIFFGGFGDNLKDAMEAQQKRIAQEVQEMEGLMGWLLRMLITEQKLEKQYNGTMEKINAEDKPDFISMQLGLVKQPAKWIREHFAYDATATLKEQMTCHCLAITGMKDVQVNNKYCDPETAKELVPNAASIEAHRPDNLTHALRSLDGASKLMNIKKDYAAMSKKPLDENVLTITDKWCDRVLFGSD